jgi:protease I
MGTQLASHCLRRATFVRRFFSWRHTMLKGTKVAILVADGFEQVEMTEPRRALEQDGAETRIVSPAKNNVQGWKHFDKGDQFPVDVPLERADPADFDALLLPGGVANPDQLRTMPAAVQFIKAFFSLGKPVGVICHGPWTLIEAEVVNNRRITSWPSLKLDLINAGANWVNEQVVVDNGLVSSRKPDDLPAFNKAILREFARTRQPAATPV